MNQVEITRARKAWLEHPDRRAVLSAFSFPMPPAAAALIILRESRWNRRAIHANEFRVPDAINPATGKPWLSPGTIIPAKSFYEISYTQRTLTFDGSSGTCKDANVDPWDLLSAVYGMQHEYQGVLTSWITKAEEWGVVFPMFTDVAELITMMHAPYSMGWNQIKVLVAAGKRIVGCAARFSQLINACLFLKDDQLPHLGLQSASKIRTRIKRLLALPTDAAGVAPLPKEIRGFPARTVDVRPMPPVDSVLEIARRDAAKRKP